MKGKLTFVEFTDDRWGGLYLDGKLLIQGNILRPCDILSALGLDYELKILERPAKRLPRDLENLVGAKDASPLYQGANTKENGNAS